MFDVIEECIWYCVEIIMCEICESVGGVDIVLSCIDKNFEFELFFS